MTLTEFLLARIDEDKAMAETWRLSYAHAWSTPSPAAWGPARVLAECEGKHRIVKSFAYGDPRDTPRGTAEWAVVQMVLHLLALPYADHPDYDPAWAA